VLDNTLSLYGGSATAPSVTVPLPASGDHAFAANQWFHAAVTYSGDESADDNVTFYWTRLTSAADVANQIGTATYTSDPLNDAANTNPLYVGSTGRNPFRFQTKGLIDEVRISDIARTPDQFVFAIPEPGCLSLVALAGLALRRRSRHS